MQLEDYFDFETEPVERIRIKGTRIDIEFVVAYFKNGMTPEQIAANFVAPLDLEQVYASITYYLHNRSQVDAYIERRDAIGEANYRAQQAKGPSKLSLKLRAAKSLRSEANAQGAS